MGISISGKWIQFDRKPLQVALDPLQIHAEDLFHGLLTFPGCIDHLAVAFNEKV
jgi:hypothetical protein